MLPSRQFPRFLQATVKLQLAIEEVGSATCRQVLQGTVDINIMGLGKIVEKLVVDNLQKVYAGLPAVASRWGSGNSWCNGGRGDLTK